MTQLIPYSEYEKKIPVLERFIRYAKVPTASDADSPTLPSTKKQLVLGRMLAEELRALGAEEVMLSETGVVSATISATPGCETRPVMMLNAHMDTSPEASDTPVTPMVAPAWDGEPITLPAGKTLSSALFPEMTAHKGEDIVTTDGRTLLGADDKGGIAAIMNAAEYFLAHKDVPHAKIRVLFTPDEEIGRGTAGVDMKSVGADYGFTVDGGDVGGLESETFNAAAARVFFTGISVHPGSSKNRMVNAMRLACDFVGMLPKNESPETTEGREGYYHPIAIRGGVESATVDLIIRDHDKEKFEARKAFVRDLALGFPTGKAPAVRIDLHDQYVNMREYLKDSDDILELARDSYRACGITPVETPVRGGTDGAFFSSSGIPCPNIFIGGMNYHGVYECLPAQSLEKTAEVVIEVIRRSASFRA